MNSAAAQVPAQRLPPATGGGGGGDGERDRVESRLSGLLSWKTLVIGACVAFHDLHRRGATRLLAVTKLLHAADGDQGRSLHLRQLHHRLHQQRHRAPVLELGALRGRHGTLAFFIGATLAWINERTNTPFKSLFFALSLIPLVIPGILFTVAWMLLASPKIGIINLVLQSIFNLDGADRIFKALFPS